MIGIQASAAHPAVTAVTAFVAAGAGPALAGARAPVDGRPARAKHEIMIAPRAGKVTS